MTCVEFEVLKIVLLKFQGL